MDPEVFYHLHKSPPLMFILRQKDPIHKFTLFFLKTNFNITSTSTHRFYERSLSFRLYTTRYLYTVSSSMRAVCPAHFIVFWMTVLVVLFDEDYEFRSAHYGVFSSPCYFVRLWQRYPRQPGILERRQPVFFPHCEKLKTVCCICRGSRHADRTKWVTICVYCNARHIYRRIPIEQHIDALHSKHSTKKKKKAPSWHHRWWMTMRQKLSML